MRVFSIDLIEEELIAACDNGRAMIIPNCSKCNSVTDVADFDFRDVALGDENMIFIGDDCLFVIIKSSDLTQSYESYDY